MGVFTSKLVPSAIRGLFSPKEKLKSALNGFELPVFPRVATEVLADLRKPDFDMRRAGVQLASDAGLSIALLRHVNSAAFGLRHPVKAVEHAVNFLGRAQLESVLIAVAVKGALPSTRQGPFVPEKFWSDGQRRAYLAGKLCELVAPHHRAESVTTALLQDLAVPALAFARPEYANVLRAWGQGEGDLDALELDVIGLHHGEVGGWLCESWGIPADMTTSIAHHHSPATACAYPAAAVAAFAFEVDGVDRVVHEAERALGVAPDVTLALVQESVTAAQ